MSGPLLVQSEPASGSSVSSLTVTLPDPTTAGNCLIAGITNGQALTTPATVSNVKIGGSADNFTAAQAPAGSSGNPGIAAWIDPGCAGGQTSVVITLSKSVTTVIAWVMEWSGLTAASPLDGSGNSGSGSSGSFSSGSTGALGASGDLIIGFTGAGLSSAPTITGPASPWTNLAEEEDGSSRMGLIAGWQVLTGNTAQTYSGTLGSSTWASVIIALKAAVVIATVPTPAQPIPPGFTSPMAFASLPVLPWTPYPVILTTQDTDAGSGADSGIAATATQAGTDAGSGADTATVGAASTDTGSGADTSGIPAAQVPGTDTGTGADTSAAVTFTAGDTGSGADVATAVLGASGSETGTAAESSSIATGLSGADTGSGTDASTTAAAPSSPDTGSGADAGAIIITSSDTGTEGDNAVQAPFIRPPAVLWAAPDKLSKTGGTMQ